MRTACITDILFLFFFFFSFGLCYDNGDIVKRFLKKGRCVTLQALSSNPTNPYSCFAWSYKVLAMFVDCMWSFGWRLEGGGRQDSPKACNCLIMS